jgi:hypothetical protein
MILELIKEGLTIPQVAKYSKKSIQEIIKILEDNNK